MNHDNCTSARNKNGRLERCHLSFGHRGRHTHFAARYDDEPDKTEGSYWTDAEAGGLKAEHVLRVKDGVYRFRATDLELLSVHERGRLAKLLIECRHGAPRTHRCDACDPFNSSG
jgi:hypothetical protein